MRYTGVKGKAWNSVKAWSRRVSKDCYTCPAKGLTSFNAQAGHCFPVGLVGSSNTLSWDDKQIRLQCGRCNGPGQGMQSIFIANLKKELGPKAVKSLQERIYKVDPVKDWAAVKSHFDEL